MQNGGISTRQGDAQYLNLNIFLAIEKMSLDISKSFLLNVREYHLCHRVIVVAKMKRVNIKPTLEGFAYNRCSTNA